MAEKNKLKSNAVKLPTIAVGKVKIATTAVDKTTADNVQTDALRSSKVRVIASSVPEPFKSGAIVSLVQGPLSPGRQLTAEMLLDSLNDQNDPEDVYKSMRSDCKPLLPFQHQLLVAAGLPVPSSSSTSDLVPVAKSLSSPSLLNMEAKNDDHHTTPSGSSGHRRKKKTAGSAIIRRHAPAANLGLQHSVSDHSKPNTHSVDPLIASSSTSISTAATSTTTAGQSTAASSASSTASSRRGLSLRSPRSPRKPAAAATPQAATGSSGHHGRRRSRASSMSAASSTIPAVDLQAMIEEVANEKGGDSFLLLLGESGAAAAAASADHQNPSSSDETETEQSFKSPRSHRKERRKKK